ncbi:MAG: S41 family peptidase [Candidatus Saccharimonadales bacterium]
MENTEKRAKIKKSSLIKMIVGAFIVFALGFYSSDSGLVKFDINKQQSNQNTQELPEQLDYRAVEEVYSKLKADFDGELDPNKLQDGLREGLVRAAGDPYTEFLDEQASKEFQENLTGSFEGIGAELDKKDELIVIVSPISGFPADKAGLRANDMIVEINGESAVDLSIIQAVQKIRGPKGTEVKLGVLRGDERLDFTITRDTISIPSVETEKISGNIGVIKLSRFGEDTAGLVRKAAQKFKDENVKGVILDLRGNPGGLLNASVDVASVWLPEGQTVLQEKRGEQVIKTYFAEGEPILNGVKTIVLINEGSASASEIVAGALRDHGAATLVGMKSFGKGSVQEVNELDFGGLLKVTIARWYTPNGVNIDEDGIKPDKTVKITEDDIKKDRDPQQKAAINSLK